MNKKWHRVKLGELIRHRKEFITIDDLADYRRLRVQLHAQGIVQRDELPGSLIKTKTQQVCRESGHTCRLIITDPATARLSST